MKSVSDIAMQSMGFPKEFSFNDKKYNLYKLEVAAVEKVQGAFATKEELDNYKQISSEAFHNCPLEIFIQMRLDGSEAFADELYVIHFNLYMWREDKWKSVEIFFNNKINYFKIAKLYASKIVFDPDVEWFRGVKIPSVGIYTATEVKISYVLEY